MKRTYTSDDRQETWEKLVLDINQLLMQCEDDDRPSTAGYLAEMLLDKGWVSTRYLIEPPVCPGCAGPYSGVGMTRRGTDWFCSNCSHVMPVEELRGL